MIVINSTVSSVGSRWYHLTGNVFHNVLHLLLVMRMCVLVVHLNAHSVLIYMIQHVCSVEIQIYCLIVVHANRIVKLDSNMKVNVSLIMSVPMLKDADYAQSPNSVTNVYLIMMDNLSAKGNNFYHQLLSPMG